MMSKNFTYGDSFYFYNTKKKKKIKIPIDIDTIIISPRNNIYGTESIISTSDNNLYIVDNNDFTCTKIFSNITNIFNIKGVIFFVKDYDIYVIDLNNSNINTFFKKYPVKYEFLARCDNLISTIFFYRWTKNALVIYASDDDNKCFKIRIPNHNIHNYNSHNIIFENDNSICNRYLDDTNPDSNIFYEKYLKGQELLFIDCITDKCIIIGYKNETICIYNDRIIKLDNIIKCMYYNHDTDFMIAHCDDNCIYIYINIQEDNYIKCYNSIIFTYVDFGSGLCVCENNNLFYINMENFELILICESMFGIIPNQKCKHEITKQHRIY